MSLFDSTQLMTNLDAVNYILISNGHTPVTTLDNPNRGLRTVISFLASADLELQTRAWSWNTIEEWEAVPDANNEIALPDNITSLSVSPLAIRSFGRRPRNIAIRRRNGKPFLFNARTGEFEFEQKLFLRISQRLDFQDIPTAARQYTAAQAANRYNSAHINDPMVRQTQLERIAEARALIEQQEDDHTFNNAHHDQLTNSLGRNNGA